MPASPSRLEDHLGYWLRKLSNHVSAGFAARLEKHAVSVPQWVVMRILYDEKSLPLKEIAARVGVDQGALSRMIDRMNAAGWTTRVEDQEDRRRVEISLTKQGRALVPKLAREADENERLLFGGLPPAQREAFERTLRALIRSGALDSSPPLT